LHWNENPVAPLVWLPQSGIQALQKMHARDPDITGPAVVKNQKPG